jgi:hypothetical protein
LPWPRGQWANVAAAKQAGWPARDSADWQQLVKICAHADTLICDEDGLYDPAIFNDRVLLGIPRGWAPHSTDKAWDSYSYGEPPAAGLRDAGSDTVLAAWAANIERLRKAWHLSLRQHLGRALSRLTIEIEGAA